ncbi:hypothetical protein QBC39DRAFT_334304 [Podospora conica]|nr:hypothetical protein QBC39DRAFT_334304 [Schizothecium conicum]
MVVTTTKTKLVTLVVLLVTNVALFLSKGVFDLFSPAIVDTATLPIRSTWKPLPPRWCRACSLFSALTTPTPPSRSTDSYRTWSMGWRRSTRRCTSCLWARDKPLWDQQPDLAGLCRDLEAGAEISLPGVHAGFDRYLDGVFDTEKMKNVNHTASYALSAVEEAAGRWYDCLEDVLDAGRKHLHNGLGVVAPAKDHIVDAYTRNCRFLKGVHDKLCAQDLARAYLDPRDAQAVHDWASERIDLRDSERREHTDPRYKQEGTGDARSAPNGIHTKSCATAT